MRIQLTDKDQRGLEQQIWQLRSRVRVTKTHPVQAIPLEMVDQRPGTKNEIQDAVSVLVEYDED